jgi:hypothetical protein
MLVSGCGHFLVRPRQTASKARSSPLPGWVACVNSSGAVAWITTRAADRVRAVAASDSGVIVAGEDVGNSRRKVPRITKVDRRGQIVWSVSVEDFLTASATDVCVADDGSVWVAGECLVGRGRDETWETFVVFLSPAGETLRCRVLRRQGTDERGTRIACLDRGVWLASEGLSSGKLRTAVTALSSEGELLWRKTLAEDRSGRTWGIHAKADRVVVLSSPPYTPEGSGDLWLTVLSQGGGEILGQHRLWDLSGDQRLLGGAAVSAGSDRSTTAVVCTVSALSGRNEWRLRLWEDGPDGTHEVATTMVPGAVAALFSTSEGYVVVGGRRLFWPSRGAVRSRYMEIPTIVTGASFHGGLIFVGGW